MENIRQYWCFACQNRFQSEVELGACSLCHSEAIQKTQGNNLDPSQFSVYQIANQQQSPTSQPQQNQNQLNIPQNQSAFGIPFVPFSFQQFSMNIPFGPPNQNQQLNMLHMNINLNNLFNTFEQFTRQSGIFNLLNSLLGQNNLVAASSQQIARLQRVDRVNDCTICQEQQGVQQRRGYKLSCGHCFHIDCLNPWLQRTNTCPTCRARL